MNIVLMFPHMNNTQGQLRLQAVKHYLSTGDSFRKTARKFGVYYPTVFKWVKLYKEQGEQRLLMNYKIPWNRIKKEIEDKIVLMKENDPRLTVRMTKQVLEREGIRISIKGIWGVWKRYGYAGFKKNDMNDTFTEFCPWTIEAKKKFELAKDIFEKGDKKGTARILNTIPFLPMNELILEIPDSFLNLRRRIEKIFCLNERTGLSQYLKETEKLYRILKKKHLNYSALRIGIKKVRASGWSGEPEQELAKIQELKKVLRRKDDYRSYLLFESRFMLSASEAIACAALLKIKQGYKAAQTCCMLLRRQKNPSPYFMFEVGILYGHLENFKEAEYWHKKSFDKVDEHTKKRINSHLAIVYLNSGKYKKATHILKNIDVGGWVHRPWILIFRSSLFIIRGMPQKAVTLATQAVRLLKSEGINRGIFYASYAAACSHCCLGEKEKARRILRRILPFLEKKKLEKEALLCRVFLSQPELNKDPLPTVKVALLVMKGHYFRALSYARKQYLMSIFYRSNFFFPEIANALIEKGKPTGLPRAILKLPVFNKEMPVFHVKFLGDLVVYKNQEYVRTKLRPKDTAFLIHLCQKAMEPKKYISLEKIYRIFWKGKENAARNLSHLLVRLKKALKIPSHLLTVSSKTGYSSLINEGVYFTTDYQEFEQTLVQAKALERADEWRLAREEYLRAFKLFRGEPFKKMYNPWSESMRRVILNKLEAETICFTQKCLKRGSQQDAKKVLERVLQIMPGLDKPRKLLNDISKK